MEDILRHQLHPEGIELLKKARAEQGQTVLLSEMVCQVMKPLAKYIGQMDHLLCNHMEFVDGAATGKLQAPIIGAAGGAQLLRSFAQEHSINLATSIGYAAHGSDLLLLSAIGRPCVVNPDMRMRRSAHETDWPIIEYHA